MEPGADMIEFYGGYEVYSESGVDLTQLRRNLQLSLEERLRNNSRMLPLMDALRKSGQRERHARSHQARKPGMLFDVEALVRQLVDFHVQYVLIGGMAMRVHGSAHVTEDLDLCYARTANNIAAVSKAFAPLHPCLRGAPPGLPFHFDPPTIQAGLNFTLTTDLGDVDLLGEVSGVGKYEDALRRSDERTLFGLAVRVLSLDGLIAAKKAAGRTKDRTHLLELEELKKLRDAAQEGPTHAEPESTP